MTLRDWIVRLAEIETRALTMADIARTLTAERGDSRRGGTGRLGGGCASGPLKVMHAISTRRSPGRGLSLASLAINRVNSPEQDLVSSALERIFHSVPTLADAPDRCEGAISELTALRERLAKDSATQKDVLADIDAIIEDLVRSAAACASLVRRLSTLIQLTKMIFDQMDFGFLFDPTRKLFSIGYRVSDHSLDPSCYDLLASEARLTSFIAIAKGDVPSTHWFHLGRALTPVDRGSALVSWSGSMFEYLMPVLVMHSPSESLIGQTCFLVVRRQRKYGIERGVPWGVSESAYNARDLDLTYQYSNFGVPGLGLKRGLSEDVVVAPYATALAAMIDPKAAAQNFARLAEAGAQRPLWLLRSARLHRHARPREPRSGRRARLYGASPGNVARGARKRPSRRRDARALSR